MTERRNRPSGASPHRPPSGVFKSERPTDTAVLWRVGAWSGIALVSLVGAMMIARSPVAARHAALNDANAVITAQARQLQHLIQQNDSETRRLSAALATLNGDRDRLYQRVTELERNVDTVTGSVTKLAARPVPPASSLPPALSAPQSVPATMRAAPVAFESYLPAARQAVAADRDIKTEQTASIAPKPAASPTPAPAPAPASAATSAAAKPAPLPAVPEKPKSAAPKLPLGIDLGTANSIEGLRAIWESTRKAYGDAVESLQPVIAVQEPKNGLGLQLRLVAGPLPDAASVEKRCAPLIEASRPCSGASFDGQRLATRDASAKPPAPATPKAPKAARSEPKPAPPPPKPRSFLPNLLGGE